MKGVLFFLVGILIFSHTVLATESPFQLIKTLGDDRDDYTFVGISDAVLTEDNEVFVLNANGHFVSRFDRDLKFVKRVGQMGQGPGDFLRPLKIDYANKKIYIFDMGNLRIAEMDPGTYKFEYYKQKKADSLSKPFFALDNGNFIGVCESVSDKRERIAVFDKQWNVLDSFFSETQTGTKSDKAKSKENQTPDDYVNAILSSNATLPAMTYNRKQNEVLVSFVSPDNPIAFFVYDLSGKLLKKFSLPIEDKKYKYNPTPSLDDLDAAGDQYKIKVYSLAIYKESYIAIYVLQDYKQNKVINAKRFCAIFDRSGKLKKHFPMKDTLWIIRECNDYFLGTDDADDIEKLYFFKLNLK